MELLHNPMSPNCRKVRMVAIHLGLPLDEKIIDLRQGEQKKPEFLRLNPNGKVPVLKDGNTVLWESNAITCYLAAQNDNDLWPKNNSRYDIMRWQSWEACHWKRAIDILVGEYIFKPEPDPKIVEDGLEKFNHVAAILNGHLESRPWVCGDRLTLADFCLAADLSYKDVLKLPLAKYGHISRWLDEIAKLDAWKKTAPPQM